METLFLLTDSSSNGYNDLYLQLASLTAILTGISVIVIKNPILSVCAPFWISFATELVMIITIAGFIIPTLIRDNMSKLSIILHTWCKSFNLPTTERAGGQKHVEKRENIPRTRVKDAPWDKYSMTRLSCRIGGKSNPTSKFIITGIHILGVHGTGIPKRSICTKSPRENTIESKEITDKRESNTGLPKSGDGYGNGVSIVGDSRMQIITKGKQSSISNEYSSESTWMKAGADNTLESMFNQLKAGKISEYKLMMCPELYKIAYHKLKSKPGNLTPGVDEETLDGVSKAWLEKVLKSLKDQSFQFKLVRLDYILKANGKRRPLGGEVPPSPRDKLVQEVMRMILEVKFEPLFLNSSHGFRPRRSCHTALQEISKWNGITWAIQGKMKGFFDNVNHEKLHSLLKDKIKDQRFLDLYWKWVKSGYIKSDTLKHNSLGVPQGGILSPLLSNIYLHELDKFIQETINKYSTPIGKRTTKISPTYMQISKDIRALSDTYMKEPSDRKVIMTNIRKLRSIRDKMPSRVWIGGRIHYCRYADDWIVGISGPRDLATKLKVEISHFLEQGLELELHEAKTHITHMKQGRAKFLGTFITLKRTKESKLEKRNFRGRMESTSISQLSPQFHAPVQELVRKLVKNGFIKRAKSDGRKLIPKAQSKWIPLDHRSIIMRYNMIIRVYSHYYSFVHNFGELGGYIINHFLIHSCAKTLAQKFQLKSRRAVFQKFGPLLSPQDELTSLPGIAKKKEVNILKYRNHVKRFHISISKDPPVCPKCHVHIHNGLYNDKSLKDLYKTSLKK